MDNKVLFLAHGGKQVGMGHVIRCLSLARQFRRDGFLVEFISKYEEGRTIITRENFSVFTIKTNNSNNLSGFDYGNEAELQYDLNAIKTIIIREKPDIFIVDTYNVSYDFFIQLKKWVKCLVYIDDIYSFDYPVDIIINGNISGDYLGYKRINHSQTLLLGLQYNLIRDEFKGLPKREIKHNVNDIMITTGAADPHNMTYQLLKCFMDNPLLKQKNYHVVIGKCFNKIEIIEKLAFLNTNIKLYYDPGKMSDIMLISDLAISAGGSTLYEFIACGVPVIAFIYADNQKRMVEKMSELGYIRNIGTYDKIDYPMLSQLVVDISNDYTIRKIITERTNNILDCEGTKRIVEVVKSLL